jgi:DNA-binding transcriptional regulator YiaG
MGKMETALKDEIVRLARREARRMNAKSAEDLRRLKQRLSVLEREMRALKKTRAKEQAKAKIRVATETVASDEGPQTRIGPKLIRALRKRLGITQAELAKLVGVSTITVGTWETGKSRPKPETKARVVALRTLGRREARRLLADQGK